MTESQVQRGGQGIGGKILEMEHPGGFLQPPCVLEEERAVGKEVTFRVGSYDGQ